MKNIFILSIGLLCFCSCEQKHLYNNFKAVNIKAWKSNDTLHFPISTDTSGKNYQYAISVRYDKEYEFSNLWLKLKIKSSNIDTAFRFEIPLFMKDGKPYGKCSGSLCTQTMPLKTNLPLLKGNIELSITQLMRKDPLDGISDIGIIVDDK